MEEKGYFGVRLKYAELLLHGRLLDLREEMDESVVRNRKEKEFDNIEDFVKANLHYFPKEKQKVFYSVVNIEREVYRKYYQNSYKNEMMTRAELEQYPVGVLKVAINILKAQES